GAFARRRAFPVTTPVTRSVPPTPRSAAWNSARSASKSATSTTCSSCTESMTPSSATPSSGSSPAPMPKAGGTSTATCCRSGSACTWGWRRPRRSSVPSRSNSSPASCRRRTTHARWSSCPTRPVPTRTSTLVWTCVSVDNKGSRSPPPQACGRSSTRPYGTAPPLATLSHWAGGGQGIASRVDTRVRRQQRFPEPDAPRLWAVIAEAVLHRPYGGNDVMRGQIEHLLDMGRRPNITLPVATFAMGGHPAAGGPFSILRFPTPQLPDVVYLEQLSSALYFDKYDDTHRYAQTMDHLATQSPSPERSADILREFLERYS